MEWFKRIKILERRVLELTEELEDINRRLGNIIRLGTVATAGKDTVDIQTGANLAKGVPFFVHAAGRVTHYRRPTKGEQCLLINLGNGDNLNNAVSLMGLRSDTFPLPTVKENEVMTDYGNGMSELYDLDKGSLVARYPGGVKLYANVWQDGDFEATGEVKDHTRTMQADRVIYNGHDHASPETGVSTSKPRPKQ
ncbi:phage baseplate assembly protein V [Vibrio scophthalmi]|uniref:phage baseplate assembly protein V n=1 Tax=Vibrio scophthalmi TaxID=45658 RepID=UPI002284EA7E|nr:phage baseplate assembly protein V [Vibrio scophthalmi]MCY9802693.1 phage baseplate assembly protein V [Vibrio scophthalmi]